MFASYRVLAVLPLGLEIIIFKLKVFGLYFSGKLNNKVPSFRVFDTPEGISRKTCPTFPIFLNCKVVYLVPAVLFTNSYSDKFSTVENLITLDKGDYFNANLGGLIIKVIGFQSKTGKNRYDFDKSFPNRCLICILTENDGRRDTEPALEAFDRTGFYANNVIGTGQFFCTAIGY